MVARLQSVYNRGVRLLHSGNYKGSWTKHEETELLKLVSQMGMKWADIGKALNRLPSVARIKWERIRGGHNIRKGVWMWRRVWLCVCGYVVVAGAGQCATARPMVH